MKHLLFSMTQQCAGLPISLISAEQAKSKPKGHHFCPINIVRLFVVLLLLMVSLPGVASDHGDVPMGNPTRHDLNITDFISFVDGEKLIMILSTNDALPDNGMGQFPTDATFNFYIDRDSSVTFDNHYNNTRFGGTIENSMNIAEDVHISFRFPSGDPKTPEVEVNVDNIAITLDQIERFAGVFDDPFSNPARKGRNVAAIVISLPLRPLVTTNNPVLLL